MTMSYVDTGTSGVQRFEVFTGVGKRRDWPDEVKASILTESYSGRETISSVARRHGLSPSQLFTWRREFRKRLEREGRTPLPAASPPVFVPAVIDPPANEATAILKRQQKRRRSKAGTVELEIDGVTVKIGRSAEASVIAAVIEALKATR